MGSRQTVAAPSSPGQHYWAAAVNWGVRLVRTWSCQNTSAGGQHCCPVEIPLKSSPTINLPDQSPPLPPLSNFNPPPALYRCWSASSPTASVHKTHATVIRTDSEFRLLKNFSWYVFGCTQNTPMLLSNTPPSALSFLIKWLTRHAR